MRNDVLDESTVEVDGLTFKVEICQDFDSRQPWKECDCFGIVREAEKGYYDRYLPKAPGERVLHEGDRNCYSWVYDWAETMKIAKRDGWGVAEGDRPANWDTLTPGQRTELAVQRDFDFLQAWCNDTWVWCGVVVTLMLPDEDGDLTPYDGPLNMRDSLWSIEYWQYEPLTSKKNSYLNETIHEIASGMAQTYKAEEAERLACEERDICTV